MAKSAYRLRNRARRAQCGFTLLEVLVALAVVAIALGALVAAAGTHTRSGAAIQDRAFAHWVAMNRIAELQLSAETVALGRDRGSEHMAERTWHWRSTVAATDDPDVQRVTIEVRAAPNDESPVARLTAFLYQAQDNP